MTVQRVGIRDLKTHLSAWLREVKRGETLIITERGKEIGRLVPTDEPLARRMAALQQAGIVQWSGRKAPVPTPLVDMPAGKSMTDIVSELRD